MLWASSTHKVIGHMWIISRRLISSSLSWRTDYSTSISHLFRTILSITTASTSEVTLIHQFICGWTDGSTIERLVKLWSELLLGCSPGSHLHTIHIDYYFVVVLAIVLTTTNTVIAWGWHHWLNKFLLLMSLRSLRVIFSLFLRLTIRNNPHVILWET